MTIFSDLDFFDDLFAEGADFGGALERHGRRSFVLRSHAEESSGFFGIGEIQIRPEFDQVERVLRSCKPFQIYIYLVIYVASLFTFSWMFHEHFASRANNLCLS